MLMGMFFELELAWGFGVRFPMGTAAQMATPLPPPTTAIGAVMEPLAIKLGLGETISFGKGNKGTKCSTAYLLYKATKAAAFGLSPKSPTGIVVKAEMNRLVTASYTKKKDPSMWSGVQAVALAYGPKALLHMMLVIDTNELMKQLKALGIPLSEEEVTKMLEKVTVRRVGSKEGIVAMKRKEVGEVSLEKDVESFLYAPKAMVKKANYYTELMLWKPNEEAFCKGQNPKYEVFVVPSGPLSSQALLTPPLEPLTLKEGYCLKGICVG